MWKRPKAHPEQLAASEDEEDEGEITRTLGSKSDSPGKLALLKATFRVIWRLTIELHAGDEEINSQVVKEGSVLGRGLFNRQAV